MRDNIYLIGFMGTGKSTVGKILADKLGMKFCDTDSMVVEKAGMSISEIFEKLDENAFRKMETEILHEITGSNGLVVSTGGGIVVTSGNIALMKNAGLVVTLVSSPEKIFERVKNDKGRPLLQVEDPIEEIKRLLYDRAPFYIIADHIIDTSEAAPHETAEEIAGLMRNA